LRLSQARAENAIVVVVVVVVVAVATQAKDGGWLSLENVVGDGNAPASMCDRNNDV